MELKEFVKNFFEKLGCKVDNGKVLVIDNVSPSFEIVYGKKGPYRFIFNISDKTGEEDLITNSSPLIDSINKFLKDKAKITVLKLDLEKDINKDLSRYLNLSDYKTSIVSKEEKFDYVLRLTFETTLQYLNETEKIVNQFYFHDGGLIDNFVIGDYKTLPGNSKVIDIKEGKNESEVAKKKLREINNKKINEISSKLKKQLEEGIDRIEKHYEAIVNEVMSEIKKNELKIEEIKKINPKDERIAKILNTINGLKEDTDIDKIEKEKAFQIQDEKQKYGLSISTTLLNKSIIYYPIYTLGVNFYKDKRSRMALIVLNSLTKQIKGLTCETCKNDIKKINLCPSNHITCDNCLRVCSHCNGQLCGFCQKRECVYCRRGMCENCKTRCDSCGKFICIAHKSKDEISGGTICKACGDTCASCRNFTTKKNLKEKSSKKVCNKCYTKIRFD